jgi:hypothetical protein
LTTCITTPACRFDHYLNGLGVLPLIFPNAFRHPRLICVLFSRNVETFEMEVRFATSGRNPNPVSMNAVFAADMLYIPSGPGYWEYDSTTSFIGQLAEALEDLSHAFENFPAGEIALPKAFTDVRFLMTRFEPSNELH